MKYLKNQNSFQWKCTEFYRPTCQERVIRTIFSFIEVQTSARAARIKKISRLDYDWINEVVVEGLASRLLSTDGTREDPTPRGDKRWETNVFVAQAPTSLVVASKLGKEMYAEYQKKLDTLLFHRTFYLTKMNCENFIPKLLFGVPLDILQ